MGVRGGHLGAPAFSWRAGRGRCWGTESPPQAGGRRRGCESEPHGWGQWALPGRRREAVWRAWGASRVRRTRSAGGMVAAAGLDDWGATGCPGGLGPPGHLLGPFRGTGAPGPAGCMCSLCQSWGATCWPAARPRDPQTPLAILSPSWRAVEAVPVGIGTGTGPGPAAARGPCRPLLLRRRARTCQAAESRTAARQTLRLHDASQEDTEPPSDACNPADTRQRKVHTCTSSCPPVIGSARMDVDTRTEILIGQNTAGLVFMSDFLQFREFVNVDFDFDTFQFCGDFKKI